MSANTIQSSLYESLLLKLVTILELTQKPEGTVTPQAKQALLHATNDFKNSLSQAKEFATKLPGGELSIEEQDEVISMLEGLRDQKKQQLSQFLTRVLSSSSSGTVDEAKMEVDSMASTPMGHDESNAGP